MLSIRLTRTGKIHAPHYRIVVQEKRSKLNGKAVDVIGHYHPAQPGKLLVLDKEKTSKWLKMGAQPSDTVANLLVKEGVLGKEHAVHHFFTPVKKEEPVAAEVPAAKEAASETEKETTEETAPAEEVEAVKEPEGAAEEVEAVEEPAAPAEETSEEAA